MTSTVLRRHWKLVMCLLALPLVLALVVMGAITNSSTKQINAAIVNLDQAVTINNKIIPIGREFTAAIMKDKTNNLKWTISDQHNADEGLKNGKYSTVIVIPKNFSAAATSFSKNDAKELQTATIKILTNDNAALTDSQLGPQMAKIAKTAINSMLTENYLKQIYIGFNQLGENFLIMANGTQKLYDGSARLSNGINEAHKGIGQLVAGLKPLSEGGNELKQGGKKLIAGGNELSAGSAKIVDASQQVSAGATRLSSGIAELNRNMPALKNGINQIKNGSQQLANQLPKYTAGVSQLYDGFVEMAGMIEQFNKIFKLDTISPAKMKKIIQLSDAILDKISELSNYLDSLDSQLTNVINNPPKIPDAQITNIVKKIVNCQGLTTDECTKHRAEVALGIEKGFQQGVIFGAKTAKKILNVVDPFSGKSIKVLLKDASSKIKDFASNAKVFINKIPLDMSSTLAKLRQGVDQGKALKDNAHNLNAGAQKLADGMGKLSNALDPLSNGIDSLDKGGKKLADGSEQLAQGIRSFNNGVVQYSQGTTKYVYGVNQYIDGVNQVSGGVNQLDSGMEKLSGGAEKLTNGLGKFNTKLRSNMTKIPSYSEGDRNKLSNFISQPITGGDSLNIPSKISATVLLIVSIIWLTAIFAFSQRSIDWRLLNSSGSSLRLLVEYLSPSAIIATTQAVVLSICLGIISKLTIERTISIICLALFISIVFVVVGQSLSRWFKWPGRTIALAMLLIAVVLNITSALPDWFSFFGYLSPVSPAIAAIRGMTTYGTIDTSSIGVLVLWLVAGSLVYYWQVLKRRNITVERFWNLEAEAHQ